MDGDGLHGFAVEVTAQILGGEIDGAGIAAGGILFEGLEDNPIQFANEFGGEGGGAAAGGFGVFRADAIEDAGQVHVGGADSGVAKRR